MAVFELTTGDKVTLTLSQQELLLRVIDATDEYEANLRDAIPDSLADADRRDAIFASARERVATCGWKRYRLRGGAPKPGAPPGGWKRESTSARSLVTQGLAEWSSRWGVPHSARDEWRPVYGGRSGPRYIILTLEGYWLGDALRIKQRLRDSNAREQAQAV